MCLAEEKGHVHLGRHECEWKNIFSVEYSFLKASLHSFWSEVDRKKKDGRKRINPSSMSTAGSDSQQQQRWVACDRCSLPPEKSWEIIVIMSIIRFQDSEIPFRAFLLCSDKKFASKMMKTRLRRIKRFIIFPTT